MVVSALNDEFTRELFTSYVQELFTLLFKHHQSETIDWCVVIFIEIYYRMFICMCDDENRMMQ